MRNKGTRKVTDNGKPDPESLVVTDRGDVLMGVATEGVEPIRGAGRPVKKVGFIVNDTIETAVKQAEETARLLTDGGVKVVESHSASPETSINWTIDDHLDLIFTF